MVKTAESDVWKLEQRLFWQEHNDGIPEGKVVICLDGVRLNANLIVVSTVRRLKRQYLQSNMPKKA